MERSLVYHEREIRVADCESNGGAVWLFTELPNIYRAIRNIRIPWALST